MKRGVGRCSMTMKLEIVDTYLFNNRLITVLEEIANCLHVTCKPA